MICQPQQVAPGQGFTLSLWFTQTHPRESDIIVVALVRTSPLFLSIHTHTYTHHYGGDRGRAVCAPPKSQITNSHTHEFPTQMMMHTNTARRHEAVLRRLHGAHLPDARPGALFVRCVVGGVWVGGCPGCGWEGMSGDGMDGERAQCCFSSTHSRIPLFFPFPQHHKHTTQKQVSGNFQLAQGSTNLPLKFKAWISPRGEEAPNYVSYTMVRGVRCLGLWGCYWRGLEVKLLYIYLLLESARPDTLPPPTKSTQTHDPPD